MIIAKRLSMNISVHIREMIAGMYSVHIIDLSVRLGIFNILAKNKFSLSLGNIAAGLNITGDISLLLSLLRAIQAIGIIDIDDSNNIKLKKEWVDALTNPGSINYIATLPRCYIATLEDFSKFDSAIIHGGNIPWDELSGSVIEAVSADAIRSANYFIEVVTKKVNGLEKMLVDGAVVYDVGCAAGHSTFRLAEFYPQSRFIGIDVLPRAISLAKKMLVTRNLRNISFENICASSLSPHSADVVILNDVLHEMNPDIRLVALKAICKALKKNGGVFFSDPLAPPIDADFKKGVFKTFSITSFFEAPYGAKVYKYSEIDDLIKRAGFNLVIEIGSSENHRSVYLMVE